MCPTSLIFHFRTETSSAILPCARWARSRSHERFSGSAFLLEKTAFLIVEPYFETNRCAAIKLGIRSRRRTSRVFKWKLSNFLPVSLPTHTFVRFLGRRREWQRQLFQLNLDRSQLVGSLFRSNCSNMRSTDQCALLAQLSAAAAFGVGCGDECDANR